MRRTKQEAELTRQALLEAALMVFNRTGYDATRLEDIAEEAGVTRGAIYHHFGSKSELYSTMVEAMWNRMTPVIEDAIAQGGTTLEILRRTSVSILTMVEEDPMFRAVCELTILEPANVPELKNGLKMKREGVTAAISEVAKYVRLGIEEGIIRTDVDPVQAAITHEALQNGLMELWLLIPDQFSLRQQAEISVDLFIRSIAAPSE